MTYESTSALLKMTIAELLDQWPAVIPLFFKYRMRCVGCQMAKIMTLEVELKYYKVSAPMFLDELVQIVKTNLNQGHHPEETT